MFEAGGKWPYSYGFVRCCFRDLFNITRSIYMCSSYLFSIRFVSVYVVLPYCSTDATTAWKKSRFILLDTSDFHLIESLSIAVHVFTRHILTSLSVDETLLPRYVNLSTNFSGNGYFSIKTHVLFAFTRRSMLIAACSRLCCRDSAWAEKKHYVMCVVCVRYRFCGI